MADTDDRLEQFRAFLAAKGLRLTRERIVVANAAFRMGPVVDPDELMRELSQQPEGRRVSRATVFRTLDALQRCGLVGR